MDYLKLRSQGLSCVLPLPVVEELINLPELATVPEAPVDIIGVMNVRGELVPVMHLGCRLGMTHPRCQETDVVILMAACGLPFGVLVNHVEDVVAIAPALEKSNSCFCQRNDDCYFNSGHSNNYDLRLSASPTKFISIHT